MRYVEATCKKCRQTLKLSIGNMSVEEARVALEAQETFHCPGHHVELSGPLNYWDIDWTVIEDKTKIRPDEEWLEQFQDKFEHIVDTPGLANVVDKVLGFILGFCRVLRNGEEELVEYANTPSGKRYYFVGPK